jgi:hypothetical protein
MFISHKSNVIQHIQDLEWDCKRKSKGMTKPEYWAWVETITDADGVVTYPSENFTIVECIDEDIQTRLIQLSDYITTEMPGIPKAYNVKYYDSKRDSEIDGVKSHFIGDDEAKDARLLAEEWKRIREQRTRLLADTDWVVIKARENGGTVPAAWKTYRVALRDIPAEQSDKTKYSEITWPTRPE